MTVAIYIWASIQNFIIGATIGLLNRSKVNYYLAGIFLLLGLDIFLQYIFGYTLFKFDAPQIIFYPDVIDFLIPALVFCYLKYILGESVEKQERFLFLPAAIVFTALTVRTLAIPDFSFYDYIRTPLHTTVLAVLVVWKGFVLYLAARLLRRNKEALLTKNESLWWWPRIFYFFLGFILVVATVQLAYSSTLVPNLNDETLKPLRGLVRLIFIVLSSSIVLGAVFFLFKHPRVLSGKPLLRPVSRTERKEADENCVKLYTAVEKERIFLENELNEKMLADHLEMPSYTLSRLLNEQIGKSFSTFINEYRVAEAQSILENDLDKRKTNFAIALESGFRSESVFYVNFKKIVGKTPAQYRKQFIIEAKAG